jgi:hypothetical protein
MIKERYGFRIIFPIMDDNDFELIRVGLLRKT